LSLLGTLLLSSRLDPLACLALTAPETISYLRLTAEEMGLPTDLASVPAESTTVPEVSERRIPAIVTAAQLAATDLSRVGVPLPEANTLSQVYFQQGLFGQSRERGSAVVHFVPQVVLIKPRGALHVVALRVEPFTEREALRTLRTRTDVEFAELDLLQRRQFAPNDPQLSNQWHHATIGSFDAWNRSLGSDSIRLAIVDSPFQMNHPDLSANTLPGWSVITNAPIDQSDGIEHSTACAGMAAAVINNRLGVAGAGNCKLVPIHIIGFTDDMYNAIIWAADHAVRVVNLSWSGADSPTLNEAGRYLKTRAGGLLFMAGINGSGLLDYPDQPDIYGVSMTDAADNLQSRFGDHIDFAAPGFQIFSTVTGSGYGLQSGTSFSTPLVAGIAALLFSINPTLSPDDAIDILKATADDKGPAGRDPFFGWGRVQFGRAAAAAQETLPNILSIGFSNNQATLSGTYRSGLEHTLWKTAQISPPLWSQVLNAVSVTNGARITFTDLAAGGAAMFYQLRVAVSPNTAGAFHLP